MSDKASADDFRSRFKGRFVSLRKWSDLDDFWQVLRDQADGWYVYAPGESVPTEALDATALQAFITELDELLRREHQEDYCGIVYVDDKAAPDFIKVYDPNNLGSACSASSEPPLPGWVFSRIPPVDLAMPVVLPAGRRRWWARLFGDAAA